MKIKNILCLFIALNLLFACKKASDPNDENEHTAINGVELKFFQGNDSVGTFVAEDPDGDGGNPPSRIDTIQLKRSDNPYRAQIIVKNISNGVVKDVNAVIEKQGTSHEFYYLPSGLSMVINKLDRDLNGYPLGFITDWFATNIGEGQITIKLMHKTLIKGPNDPPSKGHSDIRINFPVKIQ